MGRLPFELLYSSFNAPVGKKYPHKVSDQKSTMYTKTLSRDYSEYTHLLLVLSKEEMAEVFLASPFSAREANIFPLLTTLHTQKDRAMSKTHHAIVFLAVTLLVVT